MSGTDSNKSAAVAAKYVNDKKVIADVLSNPSANKTFAQARDLKTEVNIKARDNIAKTDAYRQLEGAFGKDGLQTMLAASTVIFSLTGAAQEDVLRGIAKNVMGKTDEDGQTQAMRTYLETKFGVDQANALFGVVKNILSGVKAK